MIELFLNKFRNRVQFASVLNFIVFAMNDDSDVRCGRFYKKLKNVSCRLKIERRKCGVCGEVLNLWSRGDGGREDHVGKTNSFSSHESRTL